jgi:DNA-binding transcriptional MerR regulator
MQDLEFPFLSPRIVSGLTGLSPKTLRRWEEEGIPAVPRVRGTRQPGRAGGQQPGKERRARGRGQQRGPFPRLYSWREVEQLQQATHLLKASRLSMGEIKRLVARNQAASLGRDWVIARPKPKVRRPQVPGGPGKQRGAAASKLP